MFRYVTLGLLIIAAVLVVFNILKALIRGLKKSVGSLIAIVLSAVIAAILTFVLCKPDSTAMVALIELLKGVFGEGTINDILSIEELGEAVSHYSAMLAAPIFFMLAFIVISIVVSIIVAIVVKFVPPHKKPKAVANRLGGAGVGLVCGLLVSVIVLMPLVGTISLVASVGDAMPEVEEGAEDDIVAEIISGASDSKELDVLMKVGCGPLYDLFASTEFEGEKVYLREDIDTLVAILSGVESLGVEMSQYGEEQIAALEGIVDGIENSVLLENSIAGIFSSASEKWLAGETFMGMAMPDAGDLLNPVVEKMFEIMTTSDHTNISADLRTAKDVFAIFIRTELLKGDLDPQTTLDKLGRDGAVEDLLVAVATNPHMSPLADEITKLSIRALADTIGIPEDAEDRYTSLMNDIANALNESYGLPDDGRHSLLERSLSSVFDGYGVDVEGEALTNVVDGMVGDLGNNEYVVASDVEEFFAVYASASAEADKSAKGRGYSFDLLSSDEFEIPEITVNEDGTISIGDRVLKNYKAETYMDSKAYNMGYIHEDFGGASTLFSSETMKSSIVTIDDIMSLIGKYSDCENVEAEAARIAAIFSEASTILADVDITTADPGDLLAKLGGLLDGMKDSEIFGRETASSILSAVLQSDEVTSGLGLSKKEITRFSEKMSDMANSETSKGYAEATKAVTTTLGALASVTDTNKTTEEKKQATEELINNITSESADMVSSMVTSSMVENMGVGAENTESISSALTSMLGNMASFKESEAGSDASAVASEAEAVNTILDLAMNMNSGESDKPLFSTEDEVGSIGVTADEFIDMVVNSQVVSATLQDTVFGNGYSDNPLGVPELSEEESAHVSDALRSYYENNGGGDELANKLEAIATVINVDLGWN